jgi:aspartyl-tRNA(Asn)/glutamyl-tRNA(Gln) amidotransferase subunit B
MDLEAVIGLEIHIRLDTATKMFCGTRNAESDLPNLYTCPICLGHPGTLPQVNAEAVRLGTLLTLALQCDMNTRLHFDRKNYFYPDLPKGYQITQHMTPVGEHGMVDIWADDMTRRTIRIERLHLEEDAAKLKHDAQGNSLVDFNRAGAPLAELVTKPDIRTAAEARAFVQEIQQLARYVGASKADMEKGHMRCDANVSLRPVGDETLYPKTEIKNMNSTRSIERAIEYEIQRQTELWEEHAAPEMTTTRGWDDKKEITVEQRSKEGAVDYRFFPEPDIPPIIRTEEEIEALRRELPELPQARRDRFREEYVLSYTDAKTLTADPRIADFFEETISELRSWLNSLDDVDGSDEEMWDRYKKKVGRLTTSWITSELFKLVKESGKDFDEIPFTVENFAELLTLVYEKRVNSSAAQRILKYMFEHGGDPTVIMQEQDLEQLSDEGSIETVVDGIIQANASVVEDYKGGKEKALMFLVGMVMKETKGKVNPEVATQILKEKLG